jgi:SAM-dependent methyltransferase
MIDLARTRLTEAGTDMDRVEFVTSAAQALGVPDGSADLVISTFVLQLVPDRIEALRETLRVLVPGGMVGYLTWLDRDAREPFRPAEEFDEAVYEMDIDEPEGTDEPHAGDVQSGRTAAAELRKAGFMKASAREEVLEYDWTPESYLEYKLAYDERGLLDYLGDEKGPELERNARARLAGLKPRHFRWHAPIVYARAEKPRDA